MFTLTTKQNTLFCVTQVGSMPALIQCCPTLPWSLDSINTSGQSGLGSEYTKQGLTNVQRIQSDLAPSIPVFGC